MTHSSDVKASFLSEEEEESGNGLPEGPKCPPETGVGQNCFLLPRLAEMITTQSLSCETSISLSS